MKNLSAGFLLELLDYPGCCICSLQKCYAGRGCNSDLFLRCYLPFFKEDLRIHVLCYPSCLQLALLPGPLLTAGEGQPVQARALTPLCL